MAAQSNHQLPNKQANVLHDRIVWSVTVEGGIGGISEEYGGYRVGVSTFDNSQGNDAFVSGEDIQTPIRLSGLSPARKMGGLMEAEVQWTAYLKKELWSIDWQEIQKDIRTLLVPPNATEQELLASARKIAHIANWESQKDNQNWDLYQNFKYDLGSGAVSLDADERKIAAKIIKGVLSYPLYVPVVTCVTTWADATPIRLGALNMYSTSLPTHSGWTYTGQGANELSTLASKWLKQVDKTVNNLDGSVTLTEGWIGADELDYDLYQPFS